MHFLSLGLYNLCAHTDIKVPSDQSILLMLRLGLDYNYCVFRSRFFDTCNLAIIETTVKNLDRESFPLKWIVRDNLIL